MSGIPVVDSFSKRKFHFLLVLLKNSVSEVERDDHRNQPPHCALKPNEREGVRVRRRRRVCDEDPDRSEDISKRDNDSKDPAPVTQAFQPCSPPFSVSEAQKGPEGLPASASLRRATTATSQPVWLPEPISVPGPVPLVSLSWRTPPSVSLTTPVFSPCPLSWLPSSPPSRPILSRRVSVV